MRLRRFTRWGVLPLILVLSLFSVARAGGDGTGGDLPWYGPGPAPKEPPKTALLLYTATEVKVQTGVLRRATWVTSEEAQVSWILPGFGWPRPVSASEVSLAAVDFGPSLPDTVIVAWYTAMNRSGFPQDPPISRYQCRVAANPPDGCQLRMDQERKRVLLTVPWPSGAGEWLITVRGIWPGREPSPQEPFPDGVLQPAGDALWGFRIRTGQAPPPDP